MSVVTLKSSIKKALERGKDAAQTVDSAANVDALRDEVADDIAKAVQAYLKTSLQSVIGGGVPGTSDGGIGLKTTMMAKINTI